MEPLEFMERLAALVPRPRLHLIPFDRLLCGCQVNRPPLNFKNDVALVV